jgi:hypothetical protein
MNSITEDLYLGRNGAWTTWQGAAKFRSVIALERFAEKRSMASFDSRVDDGRDRRGSVIW